MNSGFIKRMEKLEKLEKLETMDSLVKERNQSRLTLAISTALL